MKPSNRFDQGVFAGILRSLADVMVLIPSKPMAAVADWFWQMRRHCLYVKRAL